MNKKSVTILAILGLLLLLPLFVTDNEYPLEVGDFKNDVARAEQAKIGGDVHDFSNHYFGRTIMAYTVGRISKVTGLSCTYIQLGINYILLLASCFMIYFLVTKLFGILAGTLSAVLVMFCTHGVAQLFFAGDIWNIIVMCLLLVPAFYFLAKWLAGNQKKYLVTILLLFAVFSSVHSLALILPYVLGLFFGSYVIYKLVRKQYKSAMNASLLLLGIIAGNLMLSYVFVPDAIGLHLSVITGTIPVGMDSNPIIFYGERIPVSVASLIFTYITIPVIAVLGISLAVWNNSKAKIELNSECKWFLALLACFIVPLIVAAMFGSSLDPGRHAMNAGILMTIVTGCIVGKVMVANKLPKWHSMTFKTATLAVVTSGIIPSLLVWFGVSGR